MYSSERSISPWELTNRQSSGCRSGNKNYVSGLLGMVVRGTTSISIPWFLTMYFGCGWDSTMYGLNTAPCKTECYPFRVLSPNSFSKAFYKACYFWVCGRTIFIPWICPLLYYLCCELNFLSETKLCGIHENG